MNTKDIAKLGSNGNTNELNARTPAIGQDAFATTHKVATSDGGSPRAVSEVTIGVRLFEDKDLLFRILTEGGSLKNFRLVCSEAAKLTINFWLLSQCLIVKIHPINLFGGERFNSLLNPLILNPLLCHLEKRIQILQHKLKFISENPFQLKLSLSCKLDLHSFHELLLSNELNEPAFIAKTQRITTLAVAYLDEEEVKIFKDILKEINKHQDTFINLKSLQTTELADLTDFSIPNSIEYFESCFNQDPNLNKLSFGENVNICNLTNLKTIKLCSVANFKIENLQNLQALMIDGHLCEININRKECPKLTSIIIEGKEFFDSSVEIITIKRVPLELPDFEMGSLTDMMTSVSKEMEERITDERTKADNCTIS